MGLAWTEEKPKVPGFYWHRTTDCPTEVVKVTDGWANGELCAQSPDDGFQGATEVKYLSGEWYGPLEVPE